MKCHIWGLGYEDVNNTFSRPRTSGDSNFVRPIPATANYLETQ